MSNEVSVATPRAGFLSRITTGSTLAEVPGYDASLELADKAKKAGDFFHSHPDVPGILLTEKGRFRTVLSRRYYLDVVGRYCGMDLYHPRPIEFMMSRVDDLGGPLVLPADLRIEEAVRLGLERPRALVYEPLVVSDADSMRLVDFEDLLAADARVTLLRSGQMKQILATVKEGLLLIDSGHRIGLEYAGSAEAILEAANLAGRRLTDVLAGVLDPERLQLGAEYLGMLFDPRVIESLIVKINPLTKVEARFAGGRRKILAFRFTRGLQDGVIRHVLVRIEDVTREEELVSELAAQRRRNQQRLDLALAFVQADPDASVSLLGRIEDQVARAGDLSTGPGVLRELHGAKGEASLLGFAPLAQEIHQLEGELAAFHRGEASAVASRLSSLLILCSEARSVLEQLTRLGRASAKPAKPQPVPVAKPEPEGLAAALERFVAGLSAELGKPARFLWRANGFSLPQRYSSVIRETLAQLARNSLVHGIEPADERRRRGKPATATLQFGARRCESRIELVFQDDGGGLDLETLRTRAARLGLKVDSEEDLRQVIFRPGFTTVSEATLHAGRGVGLDLVRSRIESLGGRIAVHSQPGRFCAFQILLPDEAS